MKITGLVLLLAAALIGAALWLFPFTAGNVWTGQASCTPIIDVMAHANPSSLTSSQIEAANLCYSGSIARVLLGLISGLGLGVTGLILLIIGFNSPQPPAPFYPPPGPPHQGYPPAPPRP